MTTNTAPPGQKPIRAIDQAQHALRCADAVADVLLCMGANSDVELDPTTYSTLGHWLWQESQQAHQALNQIDCRSLRYMENAA